MKWASAFKYISINYDARIATVKDQTERVSFANNLNGDCIRLRFSNRYGKTPLRLDRVTVGTENGSVILNATSVTLNGSQVITLEPRQDIRVK